MSTRVEEWFCCNVTSDEDTTEVLVLPFLLSTDFLLPPPTLGFLELPELPGSLTEKSCLVPALLDLLGDILEVILPKHPVDADAACVLKTAAGDGGVGMLALEEPLLGETGKALDGGENLACWPLLGDCFLSDPNPLSLLSLCLFLGGGGGFSADVWRPGLIAWAVPSRSAGKWVSWYLLPPRSVMFTSAAVTNLVFLLFKTQPSPLCLRLPGEELFMFFRQLGLGDFCNLLGEIPGLIRFFWSCSSPSGFVSFKGCGTGDEEDDRGGGLSGGGGDLFSLACCSVPAPGVSASSPVFNVGLSLGPGSLPSWGWLPSLLVSSKDANLKVKQDYVCPFI